MPSPLACVCAGCAISPHSPVGLDVEMLSRKPNQLLKLAKRRLSPLEYEALAGEGSSLAVEGEAEGEGGDWGTCRRGAGREGAQMCFASPHLSFYLAAACLVWHSPAER
jgi:hypothetical protein